MQLPGAEKYCSRVVVFTGFRALAIFRSALGPSPEPTTLGSPALPGERFFARSGDLRSGTFSPAPKPWTRVEPSSGVWVKVPPNYSIRPVTQKSGRSRSDFKGLVQVAGIYRKSLGHRPPPIAGLVSEGVWEGTYTNQKPSSGHLTGPVFTQKSK